MSRKSLGLGGAAGFSALCLLIRIIAKLCPFGEVGVAPPTPVLASDGIWLQCELPVMEALGDSAEAWRRLSGQDVHALFCAGSADLDEMLRRQQAAHSSCPAPRRDILESIAIEMDCVFDSWLGACIQLRHYCSTGEAVFVELAEAAYQRGLGCARQAETLFGEYFGEEPSE